MEKCTSLLFNIIVLLSLSCEIIRCSNNTWISNKDGKNKLQNEKRMKIEPDRTYNTDIQFQNIKTTFNNTSYEKSLKFWAFGSHFNIYLKKQQLFHPQMTITHNVKRDNYIDMPVFYVGFSYDVYLSVVHGRFNRFNFKGRLRRNNATLDIDCPNTKAIDRDNHLKYVFPCKIYSYKTNDPDVTYDYKNKEDQYQNFLAKALPHKWGHVKKNTRYRRDRRPVGEVVSCGLHLIADHLYFKYVGSMNFGSTVEAMTTSVAKADEIFRSTDFDGDGYGDNIGFLVENITIYSKPDEPGYKLQDEHFTVGNYLNRFSEYDFGSYCLAVAFTYRDFKRGVVGLAWVANSNPIGFSGGVCAKRIANVYRTPFSFNTLVVTQLSDGKFYPDYKIGLALAHEFGHSFGAIHDKNDGSECAPNGEYGNFLMYAFVNTGYKPNNGKFSTCSIQNIYPVIVKRGIACFKSYMGPVCGNGIREEGEECDCGLPAACRYVDHCCIPSDTSNSLDKPCTFGNNKTRTCSPNHSPCCSEDCVVISSNRSQVCRLETECSLTSYCDGVSPLCPDPVNLPDGQMCNGGRQICESGKCLKSMCEWLNLSDCLCVSKPLLCHFCCKKRNATDDECAPVASFPNAPKELINLRTETGQPCNGYKGFCNEDHMCFTGSLDNVISMLDDFLTSNFQRDINIWLRENWQYVLAGSIVVLGLVMLSVITFKIRDGHVEALRVAKLTTALTESLRQKQIYSSKMESFKNKIDSKIEQIISGKLDAIEAVGRLSFLFPTAPIPLLLKIAKFSSNEEEAVRILLIKGFHMRGICISVPDNQRQCLIYVDTNDVNISVQ